MNENGFENIKSNIFHSQDGNVQGNSAYDMARSVLYHVQHRMDGCQ